MNVCNLATGRAFLWLLVFLGLWWATARIAAPLASSAGALETGLAQPGPAAPAGAEAAELDPERMAEAALAAKQTGAAADPAGGTAERRPQVPPMNILELVEAGGLEMAAIILVSIVALAFAAERFLGLRRHKVVPPKFMAGLEELATGPAGFDPRLADQLCRQHPSTAASVVQTMLRKIGRSNTEVEQAVAEASQREASRLYANVRWQNLAFNVAPMLGLLGTIQGMIVAFFVTSHLPPDVSKAECLADGIYRALVNTFAGLAVAIPAAVFAHVLEGRILKLMGELDDLVRGILPQLERFEGRRQRAGNPLDQADSRPTQPAPAAELETAQAAGTLPQP